jgi:hypothetical protein
VLFHASLPCAGKCVLSPLCCCLSSLGPGVASPLAGGSPSRLPPLARYSTIRAPSPASPSAPPPRSWPPSRRLSNHFRPLPLLLRLQQQGHRLLPFLIPSSTPCDLVADVFPEFELRAKPPTPRRGEACWSPVTAELCALGAAGRIPHPRAAAVRCVWALIPTASCYAV